MTSFKNVSIFQCVSPPSSGTFPSSTWLKTVPHNAHKTVHCHDGVPGPLEVEEEIQDEGDDPSPKTFTDLQFAMFTYSYVLPPIATGEAGECSYHMGICGTAKIKDSIIKR